MSQIKVLIHPVTPFQQNAPILYCEESKKCAFVDPGLTDEENKEECLEFSESLNWTSTFGEDDYMANIEWKHEDDGSSSKWIWDDITFMVISEVEGNWQISWWLFG